MNFLKDNIKDALHKKLPGLGSHYKLLPPNRTLKAAPEDKSRIKDSSVLLLLFEEENRLNVLLIKRPQHMKHHAGQMALPGGRIEPGETAVDTALRETWEEIGIKKEAIEILGELSEFYVEVSCFQIKPIVGWLHETPTCRLCNEEVEKIIHFPVELFRPPYQQLQLETLTGKLDVPCIIYKDEIIWGATAMILSEFYDVLQDIAEEKHI
ncbi:MAG: NUDIX hydrolase [Draconibacterium sp.]